MSASGSMVAVTPDGEGDGVEVDLVADVEVVHLDLDRPGDVLGHGLDRETEHQLLEQPAVADPFGLADEVERDFGADRDVGADPDEVEVHEVTAGGVALHLAGEGELVVAAEAGAGSACWPRGRGCGSAPGTGPSR